MSIKVFEEFVKKHCETHGIVFEWIDSEFVQTIESKSDCIGFFDPVVKFGSEIKPLLKVAARHPDAYGTLAHEICHSIQWIENRPSWVAFADEAVVSYVELIELHVRGEIHILTPEPFIRCLRAELECEHDAVKMIKKYKLCNTKDYIKKANSALYSYAMTYFFNNTFDNLYSDAAINLMPDKLKDTPEEYLDYGFCKYLLDSKI